MGSADDRVKDLLERWLASVDLHVRYLALDDAAYAEVQDWPRHQRPTRWVVELARTRLLELQRLLVDRGARGDDGFAEALELMGLLTNLLASEQVERFIPLAQPSARVQSGPPETATPGGAPLPRTAVQRMMEPAAPRPAAPRPATPARAVRAAGPASRRQATPAKVAAVPAEPTPGAIDKATATVIADAVRLISWGREWPQLAGLIARLADRPPEADVWKILRRHRAGIEAQARRPRD